MRRIENSYSVLYLIDLTRLFFYDLPHSPVYFFSNMVLYCTKKFCLHLSPLSPSSLSLGLRLSDCVSFSISLLPLSLTLSLSPSHTHTLSLSLPLPHSLTLTPCLSLILEFISISVNVARSTFCFFQNEFLHFLKIGISLSALLIVSY